MGNMWCGYASIVYSLRQDFETAALPALVMVLLPAVLMVSTIKYRSFKDLDLKSRRSFRVLLIIAAGIVAIATHPKAVLLVAAYAYLASGLVGFAIARFKRDRHPGEVSPAPPAT